MALMTTGGSRQSGPAKLAAPVTVPVTMHWMWSPIGLLIALPLPALIGSMSIAPAQYPELFGQPYFLSETTRTVAIGYLLILAVAFVALVPMRAYSHHAIVLDARAQDWLRRSVRVLSLITFSAYGVWGVAALARGLNASTVFALLSGDPGTMYVLRYQYFETLGGVTTWMQLGALLAPLAILRSKALGKSPTHILVWLFGLALVRALLNSERLALIEIGISTVLAFLILRPSVPRLAKNPLAAVATIVGAWLALLLIFSAFEYFRSWTSAQDTYGGDFWSYSSALLLGYYATALNLAAFDDFILQGNHELASLFDGNLYISLFGAPSFAGVQKSYGLETFTNRSGLIVPFVALGVVGGAVLVVAAAIIISQWARRASLGGVVSFAAYCASGIGVLEVVRIFYFGSSRFLPVIIGVAVLWLSWALSRHRARRG